MSNPNFTPHHINASHEDFIGNNGIGRYLFLPGSDARAKDIASHFDNLQVKSHPRGHHLYLGNLKITGKVIEVAAISSGMGCPSVEIILHELFNLGARRFLRVGTAGSLQPHYVKVGHLINASAAVRDESTTLDYAPTSLPAIASPAFTQALMSAAKDLDCVDELHTGVVHTKSSFYAREFGAGPLGEKHLAFNELLTAYGVLASEMEASALFVQTQLYNQQLKLLGEGPAFQVLSGAILGILAVPPHYFATPDEANAVVKKLVTFSIAAVKALALYETQLII